MGKRGGFKPGYDPRRNMNGRPPKGRAFTDILRRVGEEGNTMEEVARRVWALAKDGSMQAIVFLADRLDGKVAERLKMEEEERPGGIDFDALQAFIMGEEIPAEQVPQMEKSAAALTAYLHKQ